MAKASAELPIKLFRTAAAFEKWLAAHPGSPGLWLKLAKKDQGGVSVSYAEAVRVALCHGWIDGQAKPIDERHYMQRFTPRRPRSIWSKINVARAELLLAAGKVSPAGLREIEAAKADGRWAAAYDSPKTMGVPVELAEALSRNAKARAFFDALDKTNRYSFCWRVATAKKPETRQARVEKLVAMLARGEKFHP
jgi:uncharacterized protein YdeI (YjbR/CyaY-like superfamily)